MKVYEFMNQLKGTSATLEEIKSWSYMNRISPCMLEDGLDLEGKLPKSLRIASDKVCEQIQGDCMKCIDIYFEMELPDGE